MLKISDFKIGRDERFHKISGSLYNISNELRTPQFQLSSGLCSNESFAPPILCGEI